MIDHSPYSYHIYHGLTRSGCCVNSNPNLVELVPPYFQRQKGEEITVSSGLRDVESSGRRERSGRGVHF